MRIHLDTDLGSDTDDACALAMLLGWPGVELIGVTTTIDPGGIRAGYVTRILELAGRRDIPVCAGAEVSLTTLQTPGGIPNDKRYWPTPVEPSPSPPGAALDLLHRSIDAGATIVAIGPYTNLALLEVARPGSLGRAPVVIMGGSIGPPHDGLPAWGPEMDWNVQCDTRAAEVVATAARLTVTELGITLKSHLRMTDLERLRLTGPLGELLAAQAVAHASDNGMAGLAARYRGLPDDLLNFQYDAVASAVAVGWPGAVMSSMTLETAYDGEVLRFQSGPSGRTTQVLVDFDPAAFTEAWFSAVAAAASTVRSP